MPFPRIEHCVVCEDVRRELGRKQTIIGFYGIAPRATIKVKDIASPIERLTLLLIGVLEQRPGSFNATVRIEDPLGALVLETPATELTFTPEAEREGVMYIVVSFAELTLPGPGRYTLKLSSRGEMVYETTFDVQEGDPTDFQ